MYRYALEKLSEWNTSRKRKPLLLQGARQVGKTWLALEFGKMHFEKTAYVSFQGNENLQRVFEGSLTPQRLFDALSIESGVSIDPKTTLIVLDEIQECPRALMSLKNFQEQTPEYAIIAAGSLLGVAMHQGVSFPVGKVSHLRLFPLSFEEFLLATDNKPLVDLLNKDDFSLITPFKEKYIDLLRQYYFVGGMPEVVQTFLDTKNYEAVRSSQLDLLDDYDHDFSKYASPELSERIRLTWRSLPSQLARENKKFVYNAIRPSARARNYELAINWLVDSGLVLKVNRITKPGSPLSAYQDLDAFKLYVVDVGLLGAASGLNVKALLEGTGFFEEFKGSLTEQYVCQQLIAAGIEPYYWSAERSSGEVDFVYEQEGTPIPIEVKANENVRSKSLRAFSDKYHISNAIRLSLADYREQDWLTNIPLYAVGMLEV